MGGFFTIVWPNQNMNWPKILRLAISDAGPNMKSFALDIRDGHFPDPFEDPNILDILGRWYLNHVFPYIWGD